METRKWGNFITKIEAAPEVQELLNALKKSSLPQQGLQKFVEHSFWEGKERPLSEENIENLIAESFFPKRKESGSFFTPPEVVSFILDEIGFPSLQDGFISTLLDLSCGTGHFLTDGLQRAIAAYIQRGESGPIAASLSTSAVEGMDINPVAWNFTRFQLLAILRQYFHSERAFATSIPELQIHLGDCLTSNFFPRLKENSYNFIVLNPPYVSQKGEKNAPKISPSYVQLLKKNYSTLNPKVYQNQWGIKVPGHLKVNLLVPFIERAIELLKPSGRLGVIVHKNLLDVGSYWPLRHFILKSCHIQKIIDLSTAGFPTITGETAILVLEKKLDESRSRNRETSIVPFRDSKSPAPARNAGFQVNQCQFQTNFQECFLIYPREEQYHIKEQVWNENNVVPLKEYAELSSFGINVNQENESTVKEHPDWTPAIRGRDIGHMQLQHTLRVVNFTPDTLTRGGQVGLFSAPFKIVMQRVGPQLQACLDFEQRVCFNSTNIIVPHAPDVAGGKFLLAILNSSFLDTYYKLFLSNENVLTVNVTQAKLAELPIAMPTEVMKKEIASLVDQFLSDTGQGTGERDEILQEIDRKILDLYCITPKEYRVLRTQE